MENAIENKIKTLTHGRENLESEAEVVYLMVELRKLLEHLDIEAEKHGGKPAVPPFRTLRFYCSWTVHVEMDYLGPIQDVLNEIQKDRNSVKWQELIGMGRLRSELLAFLASRGIRSGFLGDSVSHPSWHRFLIFFGNVLMDQPLLTRKMKTKYDILLISIVAVEKDKLRAGIVFSDSNGEPSEKPFFFVLPSVEV